VRGGAVAVIAVGCLVALVLFSYLIEALRPRPKRPDHLPWAPGTPASNVDLGGIQVRYVKAGTGPNVVLLHTLRTQLDIFQKVLPELARRFTVYAFDYPGHGWSDIPRSDYSPEEFYRWTATFLDALGIEQATMVGVSIGGTIALVLAARGNKRIARMIAINPYDYWPTGGIRKSSPMARVILGPAGFPILGSTLMRLRNRYVSDRIMEGGVATKGTLPQELKRQLYDTGARPGHYRAFLSLLAHEPLWARARNEYPRITVPTLLVYGDRDWAPEPMRESNRPLIPGAEMTTVRNGGHFLTLDRPTEVTDLIMHFIAAGRGSGAGRP